MILPQSGIKVLTGDCCINLRGTVVGIVKDKTDRDSWFSAKPIKVGNLSKYHSRYRITSQTRRVNVLFCTYWGIGRFYQ